VVMGQTESDTAVIVCHGRTHGNLPKYAITLDKNSDTLPDRVGDVIVAYKQFQRNSIATLVFAYCPTFLLTGKASRFYDGNKAKLAHSVKRKGVLWHWLKRVRCGGKVWFYGPRLEMQVYGGDDKTFGEILREQIKHSRCLFDIQQTIDSRGHHIVQLKRIC